MQQHGSKYFACRPPLPLTLRLGSKGQTSTLSEQGHVAYQIKGNHDCSNMEATYFACRSPSPPPQKNLGVGSIGQNSTFSEHGHVAYHIKWDHEMQQHSSKYFAHRPPMLLTQ